MGKIASVVEKIVSDPSEVSPKAKCNSLEFISKFAESVGNSSLGMDEVTALGRIIVSTLGNIVGIQANNMENITELTTAAGFSTTTTNQIPQKKTLNISIETPWNPMEDLTPLKEILSSSSKALKDDAKTIENSVKQISNNILDKKLAGILIFN